MEKKKKKNLEISQISQNLRMSYISCTQKLVTKYKFEEKYNLRGLKIGKISLIILINILNYKFLVTSSIKQTIWKVDKAESSIYFNF